MFFRFALCLLLVSLVRSEPQKVWEAIDVRDADFFTASQFKREYMLTNQPVIIRRDRRAQVLLRALTLSKLLDLCGDKPALMGERVLKLMEDDAFYRAVRDRLNYTDGLSIERILSEFSGDRPTIREYFEGEHFTSTVKTEQDPRFPGALKDWSHPADYIWPPSLRCWRVARCDKLFNFVQAVMKTTGVRANAGAREAISAIPFVRAVLSGRPRHRPGDPADYMNIFASGDKGRGTPAHLHGFPSHNLLLVLKGKKRIVTWPSDQANKLYQFQLDRTTTDERGELVDLFMVNGFDVNLTRQPDLLHVEGGLQGEAQSGDMIYVPCGVVHALESVGRTLVLNFARRHSEETCSFRPTSHILI
jgi:hypothetical protein